MKFIELTQGKKAIVDDEDFNQFNKYNWYFNSGYAVRKASKSSKFRLHREIMQAPKGLEVDHINGDGLDNRKVNLRVCTHQENLRNKKMSKKNKSGFKGVTWNIRLQHWRASIRLNSVDNYLGHFNNKIEAAKAYDKAAKVYFGEFAKLNFK